MTGKRYVRRLDDAQFLFRAEGEPGSPKTIILSGYAAVFDEPTVLAANDEKLGRITEVVRPGAFARAIREGQDVRCLVDHNPTLLLGRTKAGTLNLIEDERGLKFEVTLPDTTTARDLHENIRLGNASQCSFAFSPAPNGEAKSTSQEGGTRVTHIELTDVDLYDVSIVTYPAYAGTTVSIEARCRAIADRPGRVSRRNTRKAAAIRLADHLLKRRGK